MRFLNVAWLGLATLALVLAAYLFRYQIVETQNFVVVLDRWTGTVSHCAAAYCGSNRTD
ncbi:hypothetical protein DES32_1785 [Methylovirgula ligni]|uniref:Uncharacterized protein n=1 Tax=Methylovirgula ligni TaxID=569860 RepID=A0A3D9YZE9_9HYPH|nr:hypothetical protein DES32_1785 [Methylovirgula ligni]